MKKLIATFCISFSLVSFARVDDIAYQYELDLQYAELAQENEDRMPSSIHYERDASQIFKMEQERFWDNYHSIED